MQPFPVSKKILIISLFLSLLIISHSLIQSFNDHSTKIVFCDVGQGDAAYIRINNRFDLLIDTGPNRKILDCLGKYMPFYDRKIEMVVLSHLQKDHIGGLKSIIDRYQIQKIISNDKNLSTGKKIGNKNQTLAQIQQTIKKYKIPVIKIIGIQQINVGANFNSPETIHHDASLQFIDPSIVVGDYPANDNDLSLLMLYEENNDRVFFTGDASAVMLSRIIVWVGAHHDTVQNINILKIPHHGSKYGLSESVIKYLHPNTAVISVGKNSYGHPSKSVLDILNMYSVKIRRTDKEGDVVFTINSAN